MHRHPWLKPDFAAADGTLRLATHSFVVVGNGLRIVVDTGIGNGKTRANAAWHDLRTGYHDRLVDAGIGPDTVDLVLLTHLHTDHVGWNTHVVDDPGQARATRHALLEALANTETLVLGTHFRPPTAGRVVRDSDGARLVF